MNFQNLFGKEADKLEHANDDERICILLFTALLKESASGVSRILQRRGPGGANLVNHATM